MRKGDGTDDGGEGDGRGQGLDGGGGVRHQRQQGDEQQKKALGIGIEVALQSIEGSHKNYKHLQLLYDKSILVVISWHSYLPT